MSSAEASVAEAEAEAEVAATALATAALLGDGSGDSFEGDDASGVVKAHHKKDVPFGMRLLVLKMPYLGRDTPRASLVRCVVWGA